MSTSDKFTEHAGFSQEQEAEALCQKARLARAWHDTAGGLLRHTL